MLSMFFGLSGRIGRSQWWLGSMVVFLCVQLALFLYLRQIGSAVAVDPTAEVSRQLSFSMPLLLVGVFFAICAWSQYALDAKRYHDQGKSALAPLLLRLPMFGLAWIAYSLLNDAVRMGLLNPSVLQQHPQIGAKLVALLRSHGTGFAVFAALAGLANMWVTVSCGFVAGVESGDEAGTDFQSGRRNDGDDYDAPSALASKEIDFSKYRRIPSRPMPLADDTGDGKPVFGKRG